MSLTVIPDIGPNVTTNAQNETGEDISIYLPIDVHNVMKLIKKTSPNSGDLLSPKLLTFLLHTLGNYCCAFMKKKKKKKKKSTLR
eukprot:TRINITY_DN6800_c0_g1_i1.p1 TRINITY_DN6800_c0_g1~~TRINITY_DN6800_c0_g1_i1.p1  ORF type:complete len:98 (+),score=23.61 TRINITY_DN6800_c0_g1_i1:42-296(+)